MGKERNQEIAEALGDAEQRLVFEPLTGGFTQSEKYVIRDGPDDQDAMFAKIIDVQDELETLVLDTEAEHYKTLTALGMTGKFFPAFHSYVHTDQARALFIEYLPDASWGGPWDQTNVEKLLKAANGLHAFEVPERQKRHISETADAMVSRLYRESSTTLSDQDSARRYESAWTTDKSHLINSRGQRFFQASPGLYERIKEESTAFDQRAGERIIIRDTNFNNIAITDERVLFVDPAYLDIGNPASDMTTLGLNVLLVLPNDDRHRVIREFTKSHFTTDKKALARTILHLVAIGTLEYGDGENTWMDYHQSMANVALQTWHELYES